MSAFKFKLPDPGIHPKFGYCCINASSLSAFCGRHNYKPQNEAFVEVLQRNRDLLNIVESALDTEELLYRPILEKMGVEPEKNQSVTEAAKELCERKDDVGAKARELRETAPAPTTADVEQLRAKKPKTAEMARYVETVIRATPEHQAVASSTVLRAADVAEAAACVDRVVAKACQEKKLPEESVRLLKRKTDSTWLRDRGVNLEVSAAQKLHEECPEHLVAVNQLSGLIKLRIGPCAVWIPSKCDVAYTTKDKNKVMRVHEIKNRKNKFFCPDYDIDQLACYVVALDAAEGILVEQFQGDVQKSLTMSKEEARARFTDQILPALSAALVRFSHAAHDPRKAEYADIWTSLRVA
jgi:hypothetical protein